MLDAISPDDRVARGCGLTLVAGTFTSRFGQGLIAETTRGICHLAFFEPHQRALAITEMSAAWPSATMRWDDSHAARLAAAIFHPAQANDPPARWQALVVGTPFQVRVWQALLDVPLGALSSYGQLASAIGRPRAARATGTAIGRNPIAFLIPCHRVIRHTGGAGHYRWGPARKLAILNWEADLQDSVTPSPPALAAVAVT